MNDHNPPDRPAEAEADARPNPEVPAPRPTLAEILNPGQGDRQVMPIRFTGSGSEYWRIWIVNLMLTVATLGLYHPWAKARRLRYFYGNTLIDGHALAFHGEPKAMLRGFLLVVAMVGLYAIAGQFSPATGLIALVILAALWPALWRASLQFRLANTSWRGLRLRFTGDLGGAYAGMALAGAWFVLPSAVGGLMLVGEADPNTSAGILGGLTLVLALLFPLGLCLLKRYQHGHMVVAAEQSRFSASAGDFYLWSLTIGLINGLAAFILVLLVNGLMPAPAADAAAGAGAAPGATAGARFMVGIAVLWLLWFTVVWSLTITRLQNLVWNATSSQHLQFHSRLAVAPMALLTLKNTLLTVITLGLYRPFAAVAMARLRLQAVDIGVDGRIDDWLGDPAAPMQDAAGDFAGDFFGIDVGL